MFPSPYGEKVKERLYSSGVARATGGVSIPLRGKGKGKSRPKKESRHNAGFPSPYGEKVKERLFQNG